MPVARFLDRDKTIDSLRALARKVRSDDSTVESVVLFGSLATGNCTPRSDADILIVLSRSNRRFVDRIGDFLIKFIDAPVATDIFPYTHEELDRTPFAQRALSTGIRLA